MAWWILLVEIKVGFCTPQGHTQSNPFALSISIVILTPCLTYLSFTFQGATSSDVVNPYLLVDLVP
jgi:hypothetical protein